jgi:hypothetical protein
MILAPPSVTVQNWKLAVLGEHSHQVAEPELLDVKGACLVDGIDRDHGHYLCVLLHGVFLLCLCRLLKVKETSVAFNYSMQ